MTRLITALPNSVGKANMPSALTASRGPFTTALPWPVRQPHQFAADLARLSGLYLLLRQSQKLDKTAITELSHLLKIVRASLESAKIATAQVDQTAFVNIINQMANHRPEQIIATPKTSNSTMSSIFSALTAAPVSK